MRIIVDPRLRLNYASWYLLGMKGKKVVFDVEPFKELKYDTKEDYDAGFAFIAEDETGARKRIYVMFNDLAMIWNDKYQWCDVYGIVNPTEEMVREYDKVVALGPECGVTLNPLVVSAFKAVGRYLKGKRYSSIPLKLYLRDDLYSNIRRRRIERYEKPCEIRGGVRVPCQYAVV